MKNVLDRINPRIYMALSGLLLGLTVIFAGIGILAFVSMIPLAIMLYKRAEHGDYRMKKAYLDGFIFYTSFDIVVFHWFTYFYPLDYLGFTKLQAMLVIALAWIGISAFQSVFSAFVFVLISSFVKTELYVKKTILLAPYAAALWSINEWTQTFTWAGVPWGRIAISQTEMPIMMQNASLFGSYFLTFVIVLFNFLLAYAIIYTDKRKLASGVALSVLLMHILCGAVLYFIPLKNENRSIKVASVQGNLESQTNWDITNTEIFNIYSALSENAVGEGAELIIWPEGVFPVDINAYVKNADGELLKIQEAVSELSQDLGATTVIGTYVYEYDEDLNDTLYNCMSVFYPDGNMIINAYSKIRIVPFGEYMPMRDFIGAILPILTEINIIEEDVTPGSEHTLFGATNYENSIKVGTLMCFDAIYEALAIESVRAGAEILIVPSNDSWFYDSRAMNMHHSQNILRAVEQGRFTVNCGNTGITSVVSNKGDVISIMPIYEEGYVIDSIYASNTRTLYSYIGNLFIYLCIGAVVAVNIFYKKLKIKEIGE